MTTTAIILAAGRGSRAGEGRPKQWQPLLGATVLARAIAAFRQPGVDRLVAVLHPGDRAEAEALPADVMRVDGGPTRTASVRNALEALADGDTARVLIHDGARPLVSAAVIARVLAALDTAPAAAPALPVTDALWRGTDAVVAGLVDRAGLWRAQTPQGFHFATVLAAHRASSGATFDDVAVVTASGTPVAIVPGDERNIKLTWPEDFARAEALLRAEAPAVRVGSGFDVHAFGPGDGLTLCGVRIDCGRGLVGHSDADVGMHALTDAILGALADGDIGQHFPPSDPQWKGAASRIFLAHAVARAAARGLVIGNADVTLICEAPKIGPHAGAMRASLAAITGTDADRIGVKATTTERLGFTGREEGIAAMATVTLVPGWRAA